MGVSRVSAGVTEGVAAGRRNAAAAAEARRPGESTAAAGKQAATRRGEAHWCHGAGRSWCKKSGSSSKKM